MYHVMEHLNDHLSWEGLTPSEQANVTVDKLAELVLSSALQTGAFIEQCFPVEDFIIKVKGHKIARTACPAITRQCGDHVTKDHFHKAKIIH